MPSLSSQENLQGVGFLTCVPGLLRRFGLDPADVLRDAGLPPLALDHPEGTIHYKAMGRLLQLATEKTQCRHFGLEIGRQIQVAALGVIGELTRNAPKLRAALQDFAVHHHRNSHGGVVYLMEDGKQAIFGYVVYQPSPAMTSYAMEPRWRPLTS